MLYLISYDLVKPEKDYPDLIAALQRLKATKVLLSEWLVTSTATAPSLAELVHKEGKLDANDRLLVVECTQSAAWYRLLVDDATARRLFQSARP